MAKKTAQELIDFAKSKLGTPYVYGAKGTKMSLAQIKSLRKTYGSKMVPTSDDTKAGKVCVDCSGLISWLTGIIRNSTGYKNTANEVIDISKRSNAHIGWAVWCQGHIGIYLGDDLYIAADGSKYGVRIANLNQNTFTHLLKLSDIDYTVKTTNKNVDVFYKVKTQKHGWLSEVKNLNDYAGWEGSPITCVAIKVNNGSIKYRVHIKGGDWLPYVTGYNVNDHSNGYAGNGKVIDAIEVYYNTPSSIRPYKRAKYKVNSYSWQYDNEKDKSQDGYAGSFGTSVTKLQIEII